MTIRAGLWAIAVGAAVIGGVVSAKAVTYPLASGSDVSQDAPEKALNILQVDPDHTGAVASESISGAVSASPPLPAQTLSPTTEIRTDNPFTQAVTPLSSEVLRRAPETFNPGPSR